jgi:HK97 family phage prohead protease
MDTLLKSKIFKNFLSETKVVDGAPRTLVAKITTPEPDRSHDTVNPEGMIADNFLKNPVVQFAHKYDELPIAKCIGLKVTKTGVLATVEFPQEGIYPKADAVYQMYKGGFLNAWSIGFMPLEYDENDAGGYNFKSWELYEFSSVPVPDNAEALTVMRSKGIDVDILLKENEPVVDPEPEPPEEVENVEPTEDIKIIDLTVAEFKDVDEVIALSYILDQLSFFISAFEQAAVNPQSIEKMKQALALIMAVVQEQTTLGTKEITIKSGRTISSKHEGLLKSSFGHMGAAMDDVQSVLDSVNVLEEEPAPTVVNDDAPVSLTKKLLKQIDLTQSQMKKTDKEVGLTLRLIKAVKKESKGGEIING